MKNIDQTCFEDDHNLDKGNSMFESTATDLLAEYEKRLKAGENPDPVDYLNRYTGSTPDDFRVELNLVTVLVVSAKERAEERNRWVASGKISKAKTRIFEKLFKGEEQ